MNDHVLTDTGFTASDFSAVPQPEPGTDAVAHGRHLSALALIYLRHAAPARAMVLGLAAMTMGDLRPQTVLLVAQSLIEAGDRDQALAVLGRFDGDGLSADPTTVQIAARHWLTARVLYRQNRPDEARAALDRAIAMTEDMTA